MAFPPATILVLGGTREAINAAHYALQKVLPRLPKEKGVTYNVTLVSRAGAYFSHSAASHGMVSAFAQNYFNRTEAEFAYAAEGTFSFVQGRVLSISQEGRCVTVLTGSKTISIPYTALVIAAGSIALNPLLSDRTSPAIPYELQREFRNALPFAGTIVIKGAGPVGLETAGFIAESLGASARGKVHLFSDGPEAESPVVMKKGLAEAATRKLQDMGVAVDNHTTIESAAPVSSAAKASTASVRTSSEADDSHPAVGRALKDVIRGLGQRTKPRATHRPALRSPEPFIEQGKRAHQSHKSWCDVAPHFPRTTVNLSNRKSIVADLYIDSTTTTPDTAFVPTGWLRDDGHICTDELSMRVWAAGPLVYALNGDRDMDVEVPQAMDNLATALRVHLLPTPRFRAAQIYAFRRLMGGGNDYDEEPVAATRKEIGSLAVGKGVFVSASRADEVRRRVAAWYLGTKGPCAVERRKLGWKGKVEVSRYW